MAEPFLDAFARRYRGGLEAFNARDMETAFRGLSPDVEWRITPTLPAPEVLKGRDAVIRWWDDFVATVDWRVEAQEFIDAGHGRVVVGCRGTGKGKVSEIGVDEDFFQLVEVDGEGLISWIRDFERREDALAAAGLVG